MNKYVLSIGFLLTVIITNAQLKPGDKAHDFRLKGTNNEYISLKDYEAQKGVIIVFTSNSCPFAKAYEQRIIVLHKRFAPEGFPVVAINPNDPEKSPDDTMAEMKKRAREMNFPFPYLKDNMDLYKAYGATRTPQVFLLNNHGNGDFRVAFIGAIDNNVIDERSVSEKYVQNAIISIVRGENPDPDTVKAIGCTIKRKH